MSLELRVKCPGSAGCCTLTASAPSRVHEIKELLELQLAIPARELRLFSLGGVELGDLDCFKAPAGRASGHLDLRLERCTPQEAAAVWIERIEDPHGPGHQCLLSAPSWVRSEREVILAAVRRNGCALELASAELRADRGIALAAVKQAALALRHVAPCLSADGGFIVDAVRQNGLALGCLSAELRADRNVVLHAVQEDGAALQFAAEQLRAEPSFVLEAARWNSSALQHAAEPLWEETSFVLSAAELGVSAAELAFDLSAPEIWHDRDFVLQAVARQASALDYAVEELVEDADFVLDAVERNPEAIEHIPLPHHPPGMAHSARPHTEVTEAAAVVSRLLLTCLPCCDRAYRVSKVLSSTTFEVAATRRWPTSPDDFWPADCELTSTQRRDLFWKCTCGRSSLQAAACLAAGLKSLCQCGLELTHQGTPIENILVMHAMNVDYSRALVPAQLSLIAPETGIPFCIPATHQSSRDTATASAGEQGIVPCVCTPHWWVAVVLKGTATGTPEMLHLDLSGPALDIFEYCDAARGELPAPLYVFSTAAYPFELRTVAGEEGRRFSCCATSGFQVPNSVPHVSCLRSGAAAGELMAMPVGELLGLGEGPLPAVVAADVAAKVCRCFLQRLQCGTGVRVSGAAAPPKFRGKVGRVLHGQSVPGRLPVRLGNEEVTLSTEALKIFPPYGLPQLLTFEEMAAKIEGLETLFPPGAHVKITGHQTSPDLVGARAEVLHFNGATKRYHVRLLDDDKGNLKAAFPWDLTLCFLDDAVIQDFFQSGEPAAKAVASQLEEGSCFPFAMFEDPAVVALVRRLLEAGLWLGHDEQQQLLAALCELAEHPSSQELVRVLRELEAAQAPSERARLHEEIQADHGLQEAFERHERLRSSGPAPQWVYRGPRHRGEVNVDPEDLRRKVGLGL